MSNNNNNHEKYDINDPTAKLTSGNGGGAVANSDSTSSSGASDYSGNEEFRNRPSEWTRLGILIGRCSLQMYRDWTVSHLMLTCHVFIGIILGLFYGNSGINAMKSYNNVGLLLIGVIYLWYTAMMPSVLKCKWRGVGEEEMCYLINCFIPYRSFRDSDPEEGNVQSVVQLEDVFHGHNYYGHTNTREWRRGEDNNLIFLIIIFFCR